MLGNDSLKRALSSKQRCIFGAQSIKTLLGFGSFQPATLESQPRVDDLGGESTDSLRNRFKLQRQLAALSANRFHLRRCGRDLVLQTLPLTIYGRQPLLRLGQLIAQ